MAAIAILLGDREVVRGQITKTETTIGRSDECDIVVANPGVSRVHAIVRGDGRQFFLHDSGSSNGLYHDERLIRELKLFDGAEVVMGKYTILFDAEGGANRRLSPAADLKGSVETAKRTAAPTVAMDYVPMATATAPQKKAASGGMKALMIAMLLVLIGLGAAVVMRMADR